MNFYLSNLSFFSLGTFDDTFERIMGLITLVSFVLLCEDEGM